MGVFDINPVLKGISSQGKWNSYDERAAGIFTKRRRTDCSADSTKKQRRRNCRACWCKMVLKPFGMLPIWT